MLTQDKSLEQVKAELSPHGIINPSRDITTDDELYLRNYTLAAAVISWDEGTYNTEGRVRPEEITNIGFASDTVWYQINYFRAIPIDIETFHAHRLQVQADKVQQEQPAGYAGDSVSCQLRLKPEAIAQYELGLQHGRNDADQRLHPIYAEASCEYSKGYLQGYSGNQNPQPKKAPTAPPTWSVTYDDNWQFYRVWVGDAYGGSRSDHRAIGRASTSQEAEQIGQKYIATGQLWQQHRERVLAAYDN
jgi:hypothetical protein